MPDAGMIKTIYDKLYEHYGTQSAMYTHPPFRMILASFLKDGMTFSSLSKTLDRFDSYPSPDRLARLHISVISEKLSLCAQASATARHLSYFISKLVTWGYLPEHYAHYSSDELRALLLKEVVSRKDVVDFILLFAFNLPVCAVSDDTVKLLSRIDSQGGWEDLSFTELGAIIETLAGGDIPLLKELSMLLLRVSHEHCLPSHPACRTCPLLDICAGAGEF